MDGAVNWGDCADALRIIVPDPHFPLGEPGVPNGAQLRRVKQRQSRSLILSTTRRLVEESGLDNVHMQTVADRSGVSLQTVYNLVGNRPDMLATAATEWAVSMADRAAEVAAARDLNVTFTMMQLFWAGSIEQRAYSRNLVKSRAHRTFLLRPFLDMARRVIGAQLRVMHDEAMLLRWVNRTMLADALARAGHDCISNWLDDPYDEGRYHMTLTNSVGLLLRGALTPPEVERLERGFTAQWMRKPS